jgi:hypothetical protein
MAFNANGILLYAAFCQTHRLGGRCLTLGRQDVTVTFDQLCQLLARAGRLPIKDGIADLPIRLKLMQALGSHLSQKPELRQHNFISDKALFAAFGFIALDSVDVSAYEGADFVHDLNRPGLAQTLGGTYDTVMDPGTLEHVFDVGIALDNVFDVMHAGSIVVHSLPLGNRIDHGFYQFSPNFLLDYYEANGFEILGTTVNRFFVDPANDTMLSLDYVRGCLDARADGGLDDGLYNVDLVARKTELSTKGRYRQPSSLAHRDSR